MNDKLSCNQHHCVAAIIVRKLYFKHGKEKTLEILEKALILSTDENLKKEYVLFMVEIKNHKD